MTYGRRPSLPSCLLAGELADPSEPTPRSYNDFVSTLYTRLREIWDDAIDHSNVAKMRQTAQYNARGVASRIFSPGDRVLLENPRSALGDGSLNARRSGVFIVNDAIESDVVRIASEQDPRATKVVNVQRITHLRDPPSFDALPAPQVLLAAPDQPPADAAPPPPAPTSSDLVDTHADDVPTSSNAPTSGNDRRRRSSRERRPRNWAAQGLPQFP